MTISPRRHGPQVLAAALVGAVAVFGISEVGRLLFPAYRGDAHAAPSSPKVSSPAPKGPGIDCHIGGNAVVGGHACGVDNSVHIRRSVYIKDDNVGKLYPANDPFSSIQLSPDVIPEMRQTLEQCFNYPNTSDAKEKHVIAIIFGHNVVSSVADNFTLLSLGGNSLIEVQRLNGHIAITLRAIDDRDNRVVEIVHDGYKVDKYSHAFVKKPDKSTLLVEDHLGNILVNIRFLNPNAISLQGVFRYPTYPTLSIKQDEVEIGNFIFDYNCHHNIGPNTPIINVDKNGCHFA